MSKLNSLSNYITATPALLKETADSHFLMNVQEKHDHL